MLGVPHFLKGHSWGPGQGQMEGAGPAGSRGWRPLPCPTSCLCDPWQVTSISVTFGCLKAPHLHPNTHNEYVKCHLGEHWVGDSEMLALRRPLTKSRQPPSPLP